MIEKTLNRKFIFDKEHHEYSVDGVMWPSPTQLLKEFSIVDDRWFREEHRERGHAVHAMTHYYDDGDLNLATLDPGLLPYLEAWRKFIVDTNYKPLLPMRELPMISQLHHFGCTPDSVANIFDGELAVVEIKSGAINEYAVRLQTAAQALAVSEMLPIEKEVSLKVCVQLQKNGLYSMLHWPVNTIDADDFLAFVRVHWLKRRIK